MLVNAEFNVRGGISSVIEAEYESEDIWGDEALN